MQLLPVLCLVWHGHLLFLAWKSGRSWGVLYHKYGPKDFQISKVSPSLQGSWEEGINGYRNPYVVCMGEKIWVSKSPHSRVWFCYFLFSGILIAQRLSSEDMLSMFLNHQKVTGNICNYTAVWITFKHINKHSDDKFTPTATPRPNTTMSYVSILLSYVFIFPRPHLC